MAVPFHSWTKHALMYPAIAEARAGVRTVTIFEAKEAQAGSSLKSHARGTAQHQMSFWTD